MIEWISVNTCTITRIGYNQEVKTMYIDFAGSSFDTPYQKVPEMVFKKFSKARKTDDFYVNKIKDKYQPTEIDTESSIGCKF